MTINLNIPDIRELKPRITCLLYTSALTAAKPDVAINVLHGRPGEDGTLQGLLEILGIPYSHSGVLASALAMQKDYAKALFRAYGVPVAEDRVLSRFEAAKAHAMAPPYVIKPVAEGSSVGVFIVKMCIRDRPRCW